MLEEVVVAVDDRPGILADIGELLGRADVNIESLAATTHNGRGIIHILVDDGEDASEILKSNGFKIESVRQVIATTLDDRPGELGRYCRRLADAGIAISTAYVSRRGGGESEVIFAVDDLEAAERI
jgi:hypothetical protein